MVKVRPAATVVLARPGKGPTGVEVALLRRSRGLRFLGSFWVFPGGRVDRNEAGPEVAGLRETFEETGLLLLPGADAIDAGDLRAHRLALLEGEASFEAIVEDLALSLDGAEELLARSGRWVTPPFSPVRFDTLFYMAALPNGATFEVIPGEMDHGEWIDPAEAVARWRRDEALLAPPTRFSLEALIETPRDGAEDVAAWISRAAAAIAAKHPSEGEFTGAIDFRPGIRLMLLRSPTLPPAANTNCMIVGDGSEVVVIDPASPYEDEQARLDAVIDGLAADGVRVREVVLTHHHPDHANTGAQHLADRLGVPIAAHARTRVLLEGRVRVTRDIEDGEIIELPADRDGACPRRLRAILTEGHADGHLVFLEEHTNTLIAGDMVAGIGTIVVDPPEGNMATYLESLARLRDLDAALLYPAHGPTIGDPAAFLQFYIDHRLERERKVLAALEAGPADVPTLVPIAYDDKPPEVYPFAERAAFAHLLKLEDEGRAARSGEVWRLA